MHATPRRRWPALLLVVGSVVVTAAGAAQEPAAPKHGAGDLNQALRDVINVGAKLFNDNADYVGCYRVYQGALLSVKPFLPGEMQQKIDASIAKAEQMPLFSDRAFELRKTIDEVRAAAKQAGGGLPNVPKTKTAEKKIETKQPAEEKKPVEPKKVETKPPVEPKKVEEKKVPVKAAGDGGNVSGVVRYEGKPLPGGFFVTLVGADGRKFSTLVQKAGEYAFGMPVPPGEYRVAIEPAPGGNVPEAVQKLPARYRADTTSGLVVRVQSGGQAIDLNLVR